MNTGVTLTSQVRQIIEAHQAGSGRHNSRSPSLRPVDPVAGQELLVRVDCGWLDGALRAVIALSGDATWNDLSTAIQHAFVPEEPVAQATYMVAPDRRPFQTEHAEMPSSYPTRSSSSLRWIVQPRHAAERDLAEDRELLGLHATGPDQPVSPLLGNGGFAWCELEDAFWLEMFSVRVLSTGPLATSGPLPDGAHVLAWPADDELADDLGLMTDLLADQRQPAGQIPSGFEVPAEGFVGGAATMVKCDHGCDHPLLRLDAPLDVPLAWCQEDADQHVHLHLGSRSPYAGQVSVLVGNPHAVGYTMYVPSELVLPWLEATAESERGGILEFPLGQWGCSLYLHSDDAADVIDQILEDEDGEAPMYAVEHDSPAVTDLVAGRLN